MKTGTGVCYLYFTVSTTVEENQEAAALNISHTYSTARYEDSKKELGYEGNQTLKGKIIKVKGMQKYIGRVTEKKRKIKKNSDFWIGLYGEIWINNYDNYQEEVKKMMARNKNKQKFYQQGIKVKEKLEKLYSESIS